MTWKFTHDDVHDRDDDCIKKKMEISTIVI